MYFYKYQKPGNLEFNMLRRGEIYFASTAELNDANECRPRFILNGSEELWIRLSEFILERVCFGSNYHEQTAKEEIHQLLELSVTIGKSLKNRVRNQDFGIENLSLHFVNTLKPLLKQKFSDLQSRLIIELSFNFINKEFLKLIEEPKYIASFSKNATNPTMWGHYAEAEKGFVIAYQTENKTVNVKSPIKILNGTRPSKKLDGFTEIGLYNDECLELKSVNYEKKPPKVNAFHRLIPKFCYTEQEDRSDVPLLLGGDAKEKEEAKIGLVKYSDWRYEQEVRVFFPSFSKLSPDIRQLRVSRKNIKGIIFGPRMTDKDKTRVVLCCHLMRNSFTDSNNNEDDFLQEFAFLQANQVVDRFDFDIEPVGVLDNHYYENRLPIKPIKDIDEEIVNNLKALCAEIMDPRKARNRH